MVADLRDVLKIHPHNIVRIYSGNYGYAQALVSEEIYSSSSVS